MKRMNQNKTVFIKETISNALKQATKSLDELTKIEGDVFHPSTIQDIVFHVHAIQTILISEYARFTDLKEELKLS